LPLVFMLVVLALVVAWTGSVDDFDKGYVALSRGEHETALHHFTAAIETGKLSRVNEARAYNNRGVAYAHLGRHHQANADYETAMQLNPSDAVAARNRSRSLDFERRQGGFAAPAPALDADPPEAEAKDTMLPSFTVISDKIGRLVSL